MQSVNQSSDPGSTFTTQELARLRAYRAAVQAGFFSDWDGSTSALDREVLAWLTPADAAGRQGYPFTAEERARLETLRARLRAGECADDGPARPPNPPAAAAATPDDASR